ncbi:MAG TPA: PAS domain S-box protein [Pyrinomonadaceae bacterium]|nr:PAS domain S-box protein [Pyrinomonadaceae bacterium]
MNYPPSEAITEIETTNKINNPEHLSGEILEKIPETELESGLFKDFEDSIINLMPAGLFILEQNLGIIRLNQAFLELTGFNRDELIGHPITKLFCDEQFSNLHNIGDLLAKNKSGKIETFIQTKNREIVPILFSASLMRNPANAVDSIICIVQDLTERKQIEAELSRNVAKFKDLFDNAPVAYHELDMEGRFTRINRAGELLLGYTNEELKGRYPWEIIVEKVSREATAAKLAGKIPLKPVERTFIRKDGTLISVVNEDRLIHDIEGNVMGMRSTLQDITERKRAETEFKVIFEIIQGVTTSSNLDELLKLIHRSIEKILDAKNFFVALYNEQTELLSMQFFVDKYDDAPPPLRLGKGLTAYIFRQGQAMLITPEIMHQLMGQKEVELVGTAPAIWLGVPLKIATRTIGVMVVQHYDNEDAYDQRDLELLISVGDQIALAIERKRAEDQLKIFNEKLQQSNRELQDFAYVASHDLQEPLRKIQAFGDRLEKRYAEALGSEGSDYVQRMRHAARRMQTLIEDLLTFSRVTTKAQPFVQVNLEEITKEVLSDLEVRIEQVGATVELDSLPMLDADPLQMRQLMQNLVGNALKFRRPDVAPVIKISGNLPNTHESISNTHGNLCQITVVDNGIGFEEKYLDRIFTVFQRLHGRGEYEGSGVGLAVCRKIVERHNGSVTAQSATNEGAAFIITLPIKQTNMEINQ